MLLIALAQLPAALAAGELCLTHGYGGKAEMCGESSIGVEVSGLADEVLMFKSGSVQNAYDARLAAYNGLYSAQVPHARRPPPPLLL